MAENEFTKIDYVIVYDLNDVENNAIRFAFETALTKSGLKLCRETIGTDVYILIHCPFERLCYEAERIKLEMNLKGCMVDKSQKPFERIRNFFETDDEVDFVSGPFCRDKFHLFEGSEYPETFFRSSLRSLLVHLILINIEYNIRKLTSRDLMKKLSFSVPTLTMNASKKGLPYLLMKKVYKDAFILHDQSVEDPDYLKMKIENPGQYEILIEKLKFHSDHRKSLKDTWEKFYKFQPLWKIRNYFGEKIAFYFAWEGVYVSLLWPPAILGLFSFSYGFYQAFHSNTFEHCYCICNSTHSPPMANYSCTMIERADDTIDHFFDTIEKTFNNDLNTYFAFFICIWGTFFMEIWKRKTSKLAYEWDVDGFETSENDRPQFFGVASVIDPVTKEIFMHYPFKFKARRLALSVLLVIGMICMVFLSIASIILLQVFMRVSWNCIDVVAVPNCKTVCSDNGDAGNTSSCFILTTILPSIINALLVLFWECVYSRVAHKLTNMENHQTDTEYNDALILKLFGFQFVNSYAYLAYSAIFRPEYNRLEESGLFSLGTNYKDTCRPGRCMSYLAMQVFLLMTTRPIMKVAVDIIYPWCKKELRRLNPKLWKRSTSHFDKHVARDGTFGSSYLRREFCKPPVGDFSLEAFSEKVIQFGYVVMFTIAFPLAPFIALIISLIDIRLDAHRLLWFNRRPVAFQASDIGQWQPILLFVNFCGVISNSFLVATSSSLTKDTPLASRLFVMLVFEHVIFLLIYICEIVIPDVPSRIKLAMRREKSQVSKLLSENFIPVVVPESTTIPQDSITGVVMKTDSNNVVQRKYKELVNCIFASDV